MSTADAAYALSKEGRDRTIDDADIIPTVRAGAVVVVPRALQKVNLYGAIVETILDSIREQCGSAEARECQRVGLEQLHTVLDGPQIERAIHAADQRLADIHTRVMKALGHHAFGLRRSFYIHKSPLLRFMVPSEAAATNHDLFMLRANRGHLSGHPPHRDYWFLNPVNSINVWMAVGPVQRENGLLIYTDMWGKEVLRDGTFARDEDFGTPLTFSLDPGDVALFDNRQLHASAVNTSNATRVVFSGRLCADRPIAPRADALEATTLWSPLVGTPLERYAGLATKVSFVYAIERLKRRAVRNVTDLASDNKTGALHTLREALRYRRADRPFRG